MERTFISANSRTESFPPSSGFIQVSQSFGLAPNVFLLEAAGGSPAGRKMSSNCSCKPRRHRLLSKNDRRTMAAETTKSKKRVDKNVNLQNVSSYPLFEKGWGRDVQIERGRLWLAMPVVRRREVSWGRSKSPLWTVVDGGGRRRHG